MRQDVTARNNFRLLYLRGKRQSQYDAHHSATVRAFPRWHWPPRVSSFLRFFSAAAAAAVAGTVTRRNMLGSILVQALCGFFLRARCRFAGTAISIMSFGSRVRPLRFHRRSSSRLNRSEKSNPERGCFDLDQAAFRASADRSQVPDV